MLIMGYINQETKNMIWEKDDTMFQMLAYFMGICGLAFGFII